MDYYPHFTDGETEAQVGKYFVQGLGTESSRARVINLALSPLHRPTYRQRQQVMANKWGNKGNSDRLYFGGLQNHCRWTAAMKLKDACSLEEKL